MLGFAVSPPATVGICGAICWPKLGAANHRVQKHAATPRSEKWKILFEPQAGQSIATHSFGNLYRVTTQIMSTLEWNKGELLCEGNSVVAGRSADATLNCYLSFGIF